MAPVHPSRPILAIDTAPHPSTHRHSIPVPRDVYPGDVRNTSVNRPMPDPAPTSSHSRTSAPSEFFFITGYFYLINMKLVSQERTNNAPKKLLLLATSAAVCIDHFLSLNRVVNKSFFNIHSEETQV